MSFFDYAMKRLTGASVTTVTCPRCGCKSPQPLSKIRLKQTMLCPSCNALFVTTP